MAERENTMMVFEIYGINGDNIDDSIAVTEKVKLAEAYTLARARMIELLFEQLVEAGDYEMIIVKQIRR